MSYTHINQPIQSTTRFASIQTFAPFGWVALGWGMLGVLLSLKAQSGHLDHIKWMLGIWVLCISDLVAMAKVVQAMIGFSGVQSGQNKGPLAIQALFWGTAKLACFGLFAVVLWSSREAPQTALLMGMGTLLVVPLLGGYFWSQKELNHA